MKKIILEVSMIMEVFPDNWRFTEQCHKKKLSSGFPAKSDTKQNAKLYGLKVPLKNVEGL